MDKAKVAHRGVTKAAFDLGFEEYSGVIRASKAVLDLARGGTCSEDTELRYSLFGEHI